MDEAPAANGVANIFNEGDKVRSCEFKLNINYLPDSGQPISEVYEYLTMNPETDNYFENVIADVSKLIRVQSVGNTSKKCHPTNTCGVPESLQGGYDGDIPTADDYKGSEEDPKKKTGIKSLKDIDEISIVAVPGIDDQDVHNALIEHCQIDMRYRVAVLDTKSGCGLQDAISYRNRYDTSHAALYYPWLAVNDPLTKKQTLVPPSGHTMGIYARSDIERGVHKAPANEVILGINGLELQLNKGEQDILNPRNVNAARVFTGRGMRLWGARTLSSDTSWQYINVRRLFNFIEKSIEDSTQWVVFEPNNEKLWARVKLSVSEFLTRVWMDGALLGNKAEEAFYVKCDRTTMTQYDIDCGKLIVEIGIAPTKPAEFVIFRITQWYDGVAGK